MPSVILSSMGDLKAAEKTIIRKIMAAWGFLIERRIQDLIEQVPLFVNGDYWRGVHSFVREDGVLVIENTVFYAEYLEYGTFAYWEIYGEESYPSQFHPKKRDLPAGLKKLFPKGMQPFAPYRRVLYNQEIMRDLLRQATRTVAFQINSSGRI